MGQVKPGGRPRGKKNSNEIISVYDESTYFRVSVCMYVWATLGLDNRTEIKWKLSKNDL